MDNMHYLLVGLLVVAILISALTYLKPAASVAMSQNVSGIAMDTVLLAGQTLPASSYIHLMDLSPMQLISGHLALKVPCNASGNSPIVLLVGSAPDFSKIYLNNTEILSAISAPGSLCIYHFYLGSVYEQLNKPLTDIAIFNPTNQSILFPATSTAVISANKVAPV